MKSQNLLTLRMPVAAGALALLLPILGAQTASAQAVYFGYGQKTCNDAQIGVTTCRIDTQAVPAGKTLTTARATCSLRTTFNPKIKHVQAGYAGPNSSLQVGPYLSPIVKTSDDQIPHSWFTLNSEMLFTVPAGHKPFVTVSFNAPVGNTTWTCNVAGTLTP